MSRITTQAEIRISILDLRKIYHELSDRQFSMWYSKRYKVNVDLVYQVIQQEAKLDA